MPPGNDQGHPKPRAPPGSRGSVSGRTRCHGCGIESASWASITIALDIALRYFRGRVPTSRIPKPAFLNGAYATLNALFRAHGLTTSRTFLNPKRPLESLTHIYRDALRVRQSGLITYCSSAPAFAGSYHAPSSF
jgi:hypothetical protein